MSPQAIGFWYGVVAGAIGMLMTISAVVMVPIIRRAPTLRERQQARARRSWL